MAVGLPGNNSLLNCRQQQLPFRQRQTEVGDIAKTIRPADLNHVGAAGFTIDADFNYSQNPRIREPSAGNISA